MVRKESYIRRKKPAFFTRRDPFDHRVRGLRFEGTPPPGAATLLFDILGSLDYIQPLAFPKETGIQEGQPTRLKQAGQ